MRGQEKELHQAWRGRSGWLPLRGCTRPRSRVCCRLGRTPAQRNMENWIMIVDVPQSVTIHTRRGYRREVTNYWPKWWHGRGSSAGCSQSVWTPPPRRQSPEPPLPRTCASSTTPREKYSLTCSKMEQNKWWAHKLKVKRNLKFECLLKWLKRSRNEIPSLFTPMPMESWVTFHPFVAALFRLK